MYSLSSGSRRSVLGVTSEGSREESCPLQPGLAPVLTSKLGHDPGSQCDWGAPLGPPHCPSLLGPCWFWKLTDYYIPCLTPLLTFGCCHCCVSLCVGTLV